MSALALPDPQAVAVAHVGDLIAQAHVARAECRDVETAKEIKRRLDAVHRYLDDKRARVAVEREVRLTEILIAKLLGPAENHGPATFTSSEGSGIARMDRQRFRALAEHEDAVLALLDQGITKRAQILRRLEQRARAAEAPPLPAGPFGVLYADPPWRYDDATPNRAVENHYPTMAVEDICALDVPAADDAALFLWATAPKLREALAVVDAWGFTYRTNAVWVKPQLGMGYWVRGRHELLLIAKRGDMRPPTEDARPPSVFLARRAQHSAKPPEVYGLIERMYPHLPRVELFARTTRDGWACWGNEVAEGVAS